MPYAFNDDKSKFSLTSRTISVSNFMDEENPVTINSATQIAVAGNVVMYYFSFKAFSVPSNGTFTLGTVKSAYRPKINYAFTSIRNTTSPYLDVGTCYIGSDGKIYLYLPSGTYNSNLYIAGTYII